MNEIVMFDLSYGLFVLSTRLNGKENACITNTAFMVADPNVVAVSVNKKNLTHDMLMEAPVFTVSILSEEASFETFKHFGFQSGRNVDKFANYEDVIHLANGTAVVTKGTTGFLSAVIDQRIDLGSHTLFIGHVTDAEKLSDVPAATYSYYHKNIKPKPAEAKAVASGKSRWRCRICGYEVEVDGGKLPEDFVCPLCKHPASDFERVA